MPDKTIEEKPKIYGILEEYFDMRNPLTKRLIKEGYVIIRDRGRVYAVKKDKETNNAR